MAIVADGIRQQYREWWDCKNKDALMFVTYPKPGRKTPEEMNLVKPWMDGHTEWIFARAIGRAYADGDMRPVEDAVRVMALELENEAYAGAGYPAVTLNSGAGCVAAIISEYARYYAETVWFELDEPWSYEKIRGLPADCTTRFAEVTLEAVKLAAKHLGGSAVISQLDLGGLADVLSSLRRTDGFLYDMKDRPEDVKAALEIIQAIWKHWHDRVETELDKANGGLHTSWVRALSDTVYYPSQCDACAMISPEMFREFIMPTLSKEFNFYERTAYHLDGSGEIPHLGIMCEEPALAAIQWVPEPAVSHWDEQYHPLYDAIIGHGRRIIFNSFKGGPYELKRFLGRFPRESFLITAHAKDEDEAVQWINAGEGK